ncbi:MAG: FAD-binding oxidoreductase [Proteobacteria bacterium]|uniref:FAD-dependent oxidoreductase n=1 Tax=Aquabacterium sp. TaxID=1872578 RepID=UPI0035C73BC6|nr:FAD-binding oxidoreductase [Pseudomonadota bacterium]
MKVAIVGGGWYGCHIASSLHAHGVEVALFEKNGRLFDEASGNNQFRLHQGLHYARSASTRYQSRDGYHRFVERYPKLSRTVESNIYLVPKETSLIDYDTYFSIMLSSGINLDKVPLNSIDWLNRSAFEGAIRCDERVVLTSSARAHFESRLDGLVRLHHRVTDLQVRDDKVRIDGEHFDYMIDATWGALSFHATRDQQVFYEPTLLLYYRQRGGDNVFPAVTLVDGALWSVYPTEDDRMFTLSSVTHTPLANCRSKDEAYAVLADVTSDLVARKRALMEKEVQPYMPEFLERFEFVGPQFAIKTKPRGLSENRACGVDVQGRYIGVQSGKIDNIFFANDRILGLLL